MDVAIITTIISGITAIIVALISNNQKHLKDISLKLNTMCDDIRNNRELTNASVSDKLRHLARKYLHDPENTPLETLQAWWDVYQKYKLNGGNGDLSVWADKISALKLKKEIEKG